MRDDSLRLADILDAINQIEKYSSAGRARLTPTNSSAFGFSTIWKSSAKHAPAYRPLFATLTPATSGEML
jgi:hypothetical protein